MTTTLTRSSAGLPTLVVAALSMLAGCLTAPPAARAAPGSWSRGADMPMAVSTPAACSVDDILYMIGGHDRSYRQLATIFAYDPKSDSWSRRADMPTPRRWLAVAPVDGIIYALGGGGWRDPVLKVVEAYDPKTDTWTKRAPMPTGRFTFAACAVEGIIYAIGGGDDSMAGLASVDAYDPKSDRWTPKHRMPEAAGLLAASTVNGRIHVLKGQIVYTYDPPSDQWTHQTAFSTWRHAAMASAVEGSLYVFGGCSLDYASTYDLVASYDPTLGTVSNKRLMPRTRAFGASAVIGGKVYLVGGADQEPIVNPSAIFWNVLDVFDPQGGVEPRILSATPTGPTSLRLTWQADVGRRYGVVSSANLVPGTWPRVSWATRTNAVLATNATMEAVVDLPAAASRRFLRIVEVK